MVCMCAFHLALLTSFSVSDVKFSDKVNDVFCDIHSTCGDENKAFAEKKRVILSTTCIFGQECVQIAVHSFFFVLMLFTRMLPCGAMMSVNCDFGRVDTFSLRQRCDKNNTLFDSMLELQHAKGEKEAKKKS